MAEITFSEIGRRLGSALLPNGVSIGGLQASGAALGQALGAYAGRGLNHLLTGPIGSTGQLNGLTVMQSQEGSGIPRIYGRYRVGGQVIWATHLKERSNDTRVGGKGGPTVTEYSYTISFAVGLCEGQISGIDRVWANGEILSLADLNYRLYLGSEDQLADPLIEAVEGATPAYHGVAYILFEDFPLDAYGARLPQLSFEVTRGVAGSSTTLADVVTGVNVIPASGEWVYSPDLVRKIEYPGWEDTINRNTGTGEVDAVRSLDQLQAELPKAASLNLTLAWFGDDLNCGSCTVRPGVETRDQINLPRDWSAGGEKRASAHLISRDDQDRPYYGGTPDDLSVIRFIQEAQSRGLSVTLSPFLLMDVPPGNGLSDPYGGAEQAAFPWRGRVTSVNDKTAAARADVHAFFGTAQASDFSLNGESVVYSGPNEWSYRRFVLHLAKLSEAAGGVDKFLLGSELRGITRLRDDTGRYPAIEQLISLAAEVRAILGPNTEISYAADWTEYAAYIPDDGSSDVLFPLDAFWADANCDFIGIDWYAPLSDWRDGAHLDDAEYDAITDLDYLASNIEGGEGYDWYYANGVDRGAQVRTPITDTAHGEDWVFRVKDIRNWWASAHHERPNGARNGAATAWTPQSKPIRLIEIGCGAVDKGTNQPNVFVDPKSSESGLPHYSDGTRDDDIQAAAMIALYEHWASSANPTSSVYAGPMIPADGLSVWCWDARPFPAFPGREDIWSDGSNWQLGHWLNGRVTRSDVGHIIEDIAGEVSSDIETSFVTGTVPGFAISGLNTAAEALSGLTAAFGIHCRQSEAGLVFYNQATGANTTSSGELATTGDEATSFRRQTNVSEHAPQAINLTVFDPSNDFATLTVRRGDLPTGDRDLSLSFPFVMAQADAEALADVILARVSSDKSDVAASLSPTRYDVCVGDTLTIDGETFDVHELDRRDALKVKLRPPAPRFKGGEAVPTQTVSGSRSPQPDFVVLDLPSLPGFEDDIRPLVGASAGPWPGSVTISAGTTATNRTNRAVLTQSATIGRLVSDLPPSPGDRITPNRSVLVRFPNADLASHDLCDVLAGRNTVAIETSSGWMLAGFQTAEQITTDTWALSGFLSGLLGTEDLACLGSVVDARLVVLNSALERANVTQSELGLEMTWRAIGTGGTAEAATQSLTVQGRALKPWRPGHFRAQSYSNGDVSLTWTRRARHSGDTWDLASVPVLEEAELYRVEVLKAGAVVRSVEVSEPSWVYTANDQSSDAVPQAALGYRVVQISALVGDGVPLDTSKTDNYLE